MTLIMVLLYFLKLFAPDPHKASAYVIIYLRRIIRFCDA